jgi:hypothetical protein
MLPQLLLALLAQAGVNEIPGFMTVARVDVGDETYELGQPLKGKKPRKMTGQKLAGEVALIRSLAPPLAGIADDMFGRVIEYCIGECWMDQVTHKVDGVDVRLMGIGPTRDDLKIRMIVVDHRRAAMRYMYSQALKEALAPYHRYYLTPGGLYEVTRHGNTLRFDRPQKTP